MATGKEYVRNQKVLEVEIEIHSQSITGFSLTSYVCEHAMKWDSFVSANTPEIGMRTLEHKITALGS